jgi:hypothetical protein
MQTNKLVLEYEDSRGASETIKELMDYFESVRTGTLVFNPSTQMRSCAYRDFEFGTALLRNVALTNVSWEDVPFPSFGVGMVGAACKYRITIDFVSMHDYTPVVRKENVEQQINLLSLAQEVVKQP